MTKELRNCLIGIGGLKDDVPDIWLELMYPGLIAAYEAGYRQAETDNAPQWHDLRKNPNDLPEDHRAKTRIVANNFGVTSAIYDWTENRWYDNYNCHIPIDNVYAWCELPEPPKEM